MNARPTQLASLAPYILCSVPCMPLPSPPSLLHSYLGRGGSASWVSRYNFAVIDLSAGPVTFGPLLTPGGSLEPPAMPRILVRGGGIRGVVEATNSGWSVPGGVVPACLGGTRHAPYTGEGLLQCLGGFGA